MRRTSKLLLAAAVLATSVSAASAVADPGGPTLPAARDLVGVGDATSQVVLNQFSADYNATLPSSDTTTPRLYSYDAAGPSPFVPKTGGTPIQRPVGSDDGIRALNADTSATVDFARSSRDPQSSACGSARHS
ncbi:hypothetical protein [Kitasatospora sp. NPDC059827]|uniref:hypothetical protein n=1 Tax=Kitasatospora sp. NPDC059827 TaxID=3346964 RepID=UPI0036522D4B